MEAQTYVKPLPYKARRNFFGFLVLVFIVALPFLYLYATGYRFDMRKPTNLVSTGGIYVAVDRTGAEIYIDGELVRETRAFRRAFYAQRLDIGTHRLHVQKEGHHTWVKELPVAKHLVTEVAAFNLPLMPQVRVIGKWQTATGSVVVKEEVTYPMVVNPILATTTKDTAEFIENVEYRALMLHFGTTSTSTETRTPVTQIRNLLTRDATTTEDVTLSTSTLIASGVMLSKKEDDLTASWVGPFEQMPYYYCAADFPPYSSTTPFVEEMEEIVKAEETEEDTLPLEVTMHPVQTVPKDIACDPTITIDRKGQEVRDFDFFPGSSDLVVVTLEDGIYVVEIDNRGWQNVQPLMMGKDLHFYIENGNIFVYDGELIYQVILTAE